MKHLTPYILTAILGLTLSFNAQAQSPEKFNYQAVLRNNGNLVVNDAVDVRFTIHDLTATGSTLYQETHNTTTDQYGLINLAVGSGTVVSGTFSTINWGSGAKYLQVEIDYGPGGYEDLGARQLLSVPYALHAGGSGGSYTAGTGINIAGNTISADLGTDISTSELQNDAVTAPKIDDMGAANGNVLTWNGTNWAPTAPSGGSLWTQSGTEIYYNTGNVGIGTNNPNTALEIVASSDAFVRTNSTSNEAYFVADGLKNSGLKLNENGTPKAYVYWDYNDDVLKFWESGADRMTIKNGEIGIGTTSPSFALDVNLSGTGTNPAFIQAKSTNGNGYAGLVIDRKAPGDNGYTIYRTNSISKWYVGQMTSDDNYSISRSVSGDGTFMIEETTGNVGIGTNTPTERLDVNGNIILNENLYLNPSSSGEDTLFYGTVEFITDGPDQMIVGSKYSSFTIATDIVPAVDNGADLGDANNRWQDVYATNGTINTSDRRDKTAIKDINYGLDEVMALHPVRYKWKAHPNRNYKLGVIAQEVLKVLPEVVKTHDYKHMEDGTLKKVELKRLGVYYSDIIPVLIKAIQEQQQIIETEKQENEILKTRVDELETKLQSLAKRMAALEAN